MNENGITLEQRKAQIVLRATLAERMSNKEFDNAPWEECPVIAREVANSKVTSRFWERRIANEIGGWSTNPTNPDNGSDYGDLMIDGGVLGVDNVELKSAEKLGNYCVRGGQCRFYEDIPWYMFFTLDDDFKANIYMMSKEDIKREIFEEKSVNPSISQGSGKTTHANGVKFTAEEKLEFLAETFEGNNKELWGFGNDFTNGRKAHVLERWNREYKVSIEELRDWAGFKQKRSEKLLLT